MNSTTPHPRLAIALAYSLLLLIALAGCNNNDTPTTVLDLPGKPVEVNIIASGIESFVDAPAATRSADAAPAWLPANEQTVHTQAQPLPNGCMMVVTATSAQATTAATTRATTTRATPLVNTTLRVVVYTATGEYVDDCLYNLNDNGTPAPQEGQSLVVPVRSMPYTFYSYSPGTLAFDTEQQVVAVGPHDDFAFAKHLAVVDGSGGNAQAVTIPELQLQSCRIGLKVTFEGGAVECKPKFGVSSYSRYSTFDMTGGDYKTKAMVPMPSFPLPSGNAEIAFPAGAAGALFAGPLLSFSNNQLVVDGEIIGVAPIYLLGDVNSTSTMIPGNRVTFSVNIYRPSPEINYVVVGGLKVAKGNLMRANGTGHWFLAPDQGYYTGQALGGDYFSWGMDNPTSYGSNVYGSNMDALTAGCQKVLGAGWRVPTTNDLKAINNSGHCWATYASQRGTSNGRYFGTTIVPTRKDDYLFLPAAGYRYSGNLEFYGTEGAYWSDYKYNFLAATCYRFDENGSSPTANYTLANGLSIRCVSN